MTDERGTVGTATAAREAAQAGSQPTIATAALLGAAERVLADVIGIPQTELQPIMHALGRLAHHLFGRRGQ